jgi:hypothetical protein
MHRDDSREASLAMSMIDCGTENAKFSPNRSSGPRSFRHKRPTRLPRYVGYCFCLPKWD